MRSMQRNGSADCRWNESCSVDMNVHLNTMDPVIFDYVRKVGLGLLCSCRALRSFTRRVRTCLRWSCAFAPFASLRVEVHHDRLWTALPRRRFLEGHPLVAGRASRPTAVGDGEGNQLSHLAHASQHEGVFREECALGVGLAVAARPSAGCVDPSDWTGGVQVSRVFGHRGDVCSFVFFHRRNADNGFYDDELAECFEQRRNVGERRRIEA